MNLFRLYLSLAVMIFLPNIVYGRDFPWTSLNDRESIATVIESERYSEKECPHFNVFGIDSQVCSWNDGKEIAIVYGGNDNLYTSEDALKIVNRLTDLIKSTFPDTANLRIGRDVPTVGTCKGNSIFDFDNWLTICIYQDKSWNAEKGRVCIRITYTGL